MSTAATKPPIIQTATRRSSFWIRYGWVAGLCLAAIVLFFFNPSHYGFYPYCVFYRTTGLQCPGCGSLRALHQLLHGNLHEALRLNVLLVISLPLLGWWMVRNFLCRRQGKPASGFKGTGFWLALVVIVLFGIARNLPPVALWLGRI